MAEKGGKPSRKPATKFPQLRKKLDKKGVHGKLQMRQQRKRG